MYHVKTLALTTKADSLSLFESMMKRDWPVWLDSGTLPKQNGARFDILACDPIIKIETIGQLTEASGQCDYLLSTRNPFQILREKLNIFKTSQRPKERHLPFFGGAIGYFGYDLHRRLETIPNTLSDDLNLPEMMLGLYEWCAIVDHQEQQTWLISHMSSPESSRQFNYWKNRLENTVSANPTPPIHPVPVKNQFSRKDYQSSFNKIQTYIREGDCYQVNLTQRFDCRPQNEGWDIYKHLRISNTAPYSAYLNLGSIEVLCASPERFLSLSDNQVETKPIKGTRPRGKTVQEDEKLKNELVTSNKDQAENLMIVDLLRNDLGKVCIPGSVSTPKLFSLESFSNVHHLVSSVHGTLKTDEDAVSLLQACFPGGSITGAPKIRATEIIEEVESKRRGIYCGSIGYIGFLGEMDTNIVIRTMIIHNGDLTFSAGGGIVYDSDVHEEYQESFDKASGLRKVFESNL